MNFFATLEENSLFFVTSTLVNFQLIFQLFNKECLDARSELKNSIVVSYEDVIDQIIWNNKNIVVDKQSLFEKHLFCQGIVKIGDLLSNTGKFLQSSKVLTAKFIPNPIF